MTGNTRFDVAVVGGGAAGLSAAIAAARAGALVVIAERMTRPGKKILITGGGRCNLSNTSLSPADFTSTDPGLVRAAFEKVDGQAILRFFRGLGLATYDEDGRIFPITNQAVSVLKVLELEIARLGVKVELGCEITSLRPAPPGLSIEAGDGRMFEASTVVLTGGGRSYPALGSNGSAYGLAQKIGHTVIPPVPSAVPLLVKDKLCHFLQGQKIRGRAAALVEGKETAAAEGDILFTAYGLSGTAILDVSEPLSIALNRSGIGKTELLADFVPFFSRDELADNFRKRLAGGWAETDLAAGILPEKFGPLLPTLVHSSSLSSASQADGPARAASLAAALKSHRFTVLGTRGWNEAEFTAGGVDAREVERTTMESKKRRGVFLAGELLDVQGPRGGFNLAWAWASGLIAGEAAARACPVLGVRS